VPSLQKRTEAAVALVVRPAGAAGAELLLVRRATYPGDPWSGHIALPGGRREPGDSTLEATALRETWEETGLTLAAADCVAALTPLEPHLVARPALIVHPFVFRYHGARAVSPSEEIADAFWLSLRALGDPSAWSAIDVVLGDAARTVRGFRHEDQVIWGLTERVLADFLARDALVRSLAR